MVATPDSSTPVDAPVEESDAAIPSCSSFSNGVQLSAPTQSITLSANTPYRVDLTGVVGTETRMITDLLFGMIPVQVRAHSHSGRDMVVIEVADFTMADGSQLRITGDTPVIIASSGSITIDGVLNVSGGCPGGNRTCAGPGGSPGPINVNITPNGCAPGDHGDGQAGATPETGGGGGGFGSVGAKGGGDTGGAGGQMCNEVDLDPLTGGSPGGAGAIPTGGGEGGGAGGAIQLSAALSIRFDSTGLLPTGINAGGAGGGGGTISDGGGGGGSGGAILIEAPSIELMDLAILAANGGGGGGGGSGASPGLPGASGVLGVLPAGGGLGARFGGLGAFGSTAATVGAGVDSDDETGGGGGGVGVIRLHVDATALTNNGMTTPAPTLGASCL